MSNRVSKEIALQIFGASTWPKKGVSFDIASDNLSCVSPLNFL